MTSRIPAWLTPVKDSKGHVIDFKPIPERAKIIEAIFKDASSGLGKFSIASRLNKAAELSWGNGGGWYPSYIQKILDNRAVIGEYQPHRKVATEFDPKARKRVGGKRVPEGPAITDYYPAVISVALWERTKAARALRRGKGGRKGKTLRNLFSGLCRCWECESTMTYRYPGNHIKSGRDYLICNRALRKAGCSNRQKHYYYELVEAPILMYLNELLFDPADLASQTSAIQEAENAVATLANQRSSKEVEIRRLIDAIATGANPYLTDAISSRGAEIDRIVEQERAAKTRLEELRGQITTSERRAALHALQKDLASDDDTILFAARSRLSQELKSVITSITFEQDAFVISVAHGLRLYQFRNGALELLHLENLEQPLTNHKKTIADRIARIQKAEPTEAILPSME